MGRINDIDVHELVHGLVDSYLNGFEVPDKIMRLPIYGSVVRSKQEIVLPEVRKFIERAFSRSSKGDPSIKVIVEKDHYSDLWVIRIQNSATGRPAGLDHLIEKLIFQ